MFLKNYTNKTFIIAEIGVNHNGNVELAKQLIDVSIQCGADAVKFQTFNTDKVISKNAPKANYQKLNDDDNITQYEMVKQLELSKDDFIYLKKYCDDKNIMFISTPFDIDSVKLLNDLNVEMYKVGSGDCDNLLLLKEIINTNKPVIISTGMSDLNEIKLITKRIKEIDYIKCD